ncbi:GNAT family N-acetyltransferase [Planobispora siamensis]|uniref:N-acetyltransferase n=1 Tax=Planobispora siamensis TaxID=936338 RepID=A0A8J3SSB4_9ACTN|nr:GNAT family N-acetyltransferase [Planobispora siamensis]GIH97494.1 N-acetyltransferase [Planobispora siamensis]
MHTTPTTHIITRLSADDFHDNLHGLATLLADVVSDGASLGFLTPFDHAAASTWWSKHAPAVAEGSLIIWTAHHDGRTEATISLAFEPKPNGRHRAEILKLMVHPRARGHGLARALLTTAEQAAAQAGAHLLLLDTETGSPAEHLYHATGWTRYGIVPGYATDPSGVLRDCSFFYKRLTPTPDR